MPNCNKALDFSKNRADGDDILGDAYEYLMRHFATWRDCVAARLKGLRAGKTRLVAK